MDEATRLQDREFYRRVGHLAALVEKAAEALQLWLELDLHTEAATALMMTGNAPSQVEFDRLVALRLKALAATKQFSQGGKL